MNSHDSCHAEAQWFVVCFHRDHYAKDLAPHNMNSHASQSDFPVTITTDLYLPSFSLKRVR